MMTMTLNKPKNTILLDESSGTCPHLIPSDWIEKSLTTPSKQHDLTRQHPMIIHIDADALPTIAKDLIVKTVGRTQVQAVFVANKPIKLPPSPYLRMMVVAQGFDVADNFIATQVRMGDLVITSDIPLADEVLAKGAKVLTPRGEEFTASNIKAKLNARDFMESLRGTGVLDPNQMGGQKPYGDKDKQAFANGLNRLVRPNLSPNNSPS